MDPIITVGKELRFLRFVFDIDVKTMQDYFGYSRSTISEFENKARAPMFHREVVLRWFFNRVFEDIKNGKDKEIGKPKDYYSIIPFYNEYLKDQTLSIRDIKRDAANKYPYIFKSKNLKKKESINLIKEVIDHWYAYEEDKAKRHGETFKLSDDIIKDKANYKSMFRGWMTRFYGQNHWSKYYSVIRDYNMRKSDCDWWMHPSYCPSVIKFLYWVSYPYQTIWPDMNIADLIVACRYILNYSLDGYLKLIGLSNTEWNQFVKMENEERITMEWRIYLKLVMQRIIRRVLFNEKKAFFENLEWLFNEVDHYARNIVDTLNLNSALKFHEIRLIDKRLNPSNIFINLPMSPNEFNPTNFKGGFEKLFNRFISLDKEEDLLFKTVYGLDTRMVKFYH